jgi:hypothetical protein
MNRANDHGFGHIKRHKTRIPAVVTGMTTLLVTLEGFESNQLVLMPAPSREFLL